MKIVLLAFLFFSFNIPGFSQLKYIVEDFEGFSDASSDLKANGVFTFGNINARMDTKMPVHKSYSGERCIELNKTGKLAYGGWGKGIGLNIELDVNKDFLNFYVYQPVTNDTNTIKIELQEDDNGNTVFEKELDDSWICNQKLDNKNSWKLISIPLNKFVDSNHGGDGLFNIDYKQGKLFCVIISFINKPVMKAGLIAGNSEQTWSFDFICFSQGKLPVGPGIFDAPAAKKNDFCSLGAWSKEGNVADFADIPVSFEKIFNSGKKLGVVHFFQPFAFDGGNTQNLYPSVERINKVIHTGYVPMITLEDHFVNLTAGKAGSATSVKQPNLYSIVEGHFDGFFADWARQIKKVDGIVLLRILHEFNGDWYPWCTVNNDKNPQLLIKAFRHIHTVFKEQGVRNVKFIWCPNSMSWPQEKWNFIMDAYPGDEYVDYVGLDIYNGAGKGMPVWRSFRKEGIENYFILTQRIPQKALFICETASRENEKKSSHQAQTKGEWIRQMAQTLNSDMSNVRLLTWFNEKGSFKINSSPDAQNAYLNYILKNDYFKSGTKSIYPLIKN